MSRSQLPSRAEVLSRHPGLAPSTLAYWRRHNCKAIRKKLGATRQRKHRGRFGYPVAPVDRAVAIRSRARPHDCVEFTDVRGTWIARHTAQQFCGFSMTAIDRWVREGNVGYRDEPAAGDPPWRRFLRKEDLETIIAQRQVPPAARNPVRSVPELNQLRDDEFVTAAEAEKLGFGRTFLMTYSTSNDPRRKRPGRAHPLLGRMIRSGWRERVAGKQFVRERVWNLGDLRKLPPLNDQKSFDTGLVTAAASGICRNTLRHLWKTGKIWGTVKPAPDPRGYVVEQMHFRANEVEQLRLRLDAHKRGDSRRIWLDELGRVVDYYPQSEAIAIINGDGQGTKRRSERHLPCDRIKPIDLFRWRSAQMGGEGEKCPHLDRTINCRRAPMANYRNKHGAEMLVYSGDDLRRIKAGLRGWSEPEAGPPPPKPLASAGNAVPATAIVPTRRGRPRNSEREHEEYRELASGWERAKHHMTKKEFADMRGVTVKIVERARVWVIRYGNRLCN